MTITARWGNPKSIQLVVKEDGVATDITGWTIIFSVGKVTQVSATTALLQKTITSHTTPLEGKTQVSLSANDVKFVPGQYFYDFKLFDTTGVQRNTSKGSFILEEVITTNEI